MTTPAGVPPVLRETERHGDNDHDHLYDRRLRCFLLLRKCALRPAAGCGAPDPLHSALVVGTSSLSLREFIGGGFAGVTSARRAKLHCWQEIYTPSLQLRYLKFHCWARRSSSLWTRSKYSSVVTPRLCVGAEDPQQPQWVYFAVVFSVVVFSPTASQLFGSKIANQNFARCPDWFP